MTIDRRGRIHNARRKRTAELNRFEGRLGPRRGNLPGQVADLIATTFQVSTTRQKRSGVYTYIHTCLCIYTGDTMVVINSIAYSGIPPVS